MQTFSKHLPTTASAPELSGPARRKRSPAPTGAPPGDMVESLARGLRVLRCFGPDAATLGNLDIARLTGLPKSTVSRIVNTLTAHGYLRYHPDTGRYSPGYGVLALGFGLLANLEIRQLARPLMDELAQATGGAVALGAFDGDAMTYLEAVHGSSALYLRLPVGYRVGFDSAMGRAYLAAQSPERRAALLSRAAQPSLSVEALDQACRDLDATGCCFALGEWQSGIHAAATPFTSFGDDACFVMSCGGPASLLPEDRLRNEIAPMLRAAVAKLAPR